MSKIGEYVKKQHQCLRSYLKLVRIQPKMECNWAVVVELVAVEAVLPGALCAGAFS